MFKKKRKTLAEYIFLKAVNVPVKLILSLWCVSLRFCSFALLTFVTSSGFNVIISKCWYFLFSWKRQATKKKKTCLHEDDYIKECYCTWNSSYLCKHTLTVDYLTKRICSNTKGVSVAQRRQAEQHSCLKGLREQKTFSTVSWGKSL